MFSRCSIKVCFRHIRPNVSAPRGSAMGRLNSFDRRRPNGRNRERRETGKEQMVQVHYDEGAAIHIGAESCACGREAVREALTGECAGQPLSRDKVDIPGADAVRYAEGHTKGRAIASSPTTRRGRRPGMCRHSLFGNREVSWLTKAACRDWSASGRRGAEADDARPREV